MKRQIRIPVESSSRPIIGQKLKIDGVDMKITEVKECKLQSMCFYDILDMFAPESYHKDKMYATFTGREYSFSYAKEQWNETYGYTDFSWENNPYVYVSYLRYFIDEPKNN